tara:strand:+ start:297 stop:545 length:249 start_codon:yes stop_codon:yes gene_type:complete
MKNETTNNTATNKTTVDEYEARELAELSHYKQMLRDLKRKQSGDLIGDESFTALDERQLAFLENQIKTMQTKMTTTTGKTKK